MRVLSSSALCLVSLVACVGNSSEPIAEESSTHAGSALHLGDPKGTCEAGYVTVWAKGSSGPSTDVNAILANCPYLTAQMNWVDSVNHDVPYSAWPSSMRARLQSFFKAMVTGNRVTDIACPDPRGADRGRTILAGNYPHGTPMDLYFTTAQAQDMYLASVAHALSIEVRHDLGWSLLDYPSAELAPILGARAIAAPTSQVPRPFGSPISDATYRVPVGHEHSVGFVCNPADGYDFLRGHTSTTHIDLVAATKEETLANLTYFLSRNSVHGFPLDVYESVDTYQFTLAERLHRGRDLTTGGPSPWIVERIGCHSTAETLEELARTLNIPLLNVASYGNGWRDGLDHPFQAVTHRALAFSWTTAARRILPHADFVNATALNPNYRSGETATGYYDLVWRTPEAYSAMGISVDMSMPTVPVLPTNSVISFETYYDFGRVLSVLGPNEGRYYLRTDACAWDIVRTYCLDPAGGPGAFARNHPWGYPELSDPTLLRAAYDRAAACVAALPMHCAAVPASYPSTTATLYLP